ncbi:MAG: hypothetical protein K8I00_07090, partial [Candidatus Omnitrophica bacterium]|nr:hypothetical protein [Candidatus Omnitrophota bacterium]
TDLSTNDESTESSESEDTVDTSVILTNTVDVLVDASKTITKEETTKQSVKNILVVSGSSQATLQTISNLNAVGSAVNVQTNVVNSSSVQGNITQSNVGTAINGQF